MLRSLRFRLPALFLLGMVLSCVVATLIAVHFFQSYTRTHAASELRGELTGIVHLYETQAGTGHVSVAQLKVALGGDELFWVPVVPGGSLLAGPLPPLPATAVPSAVLQGGNPPAFDLKVGSASYLGVGQVVNLGSGSAVFPAGALVVAEPESQLRSRWLQLAWELALAFGIVIPVAGALVVYFTHRIVRPLETLTVAVDEVAAGHYDVVMPERTGGSEVERLAARFDEMTARLAESEELSRNFLMSVSHELRTPLTAIRGYSELALRHPGPVPEEVRHALGRVQSESARMSVLVDDLLLLARLDAGRPLASDPVDLSRLCIDATSDARAASDDHRWRLELPDDPVVVPGDEHRLHQVLANLLGNAGQHTPAGTTVTVTLTDPGPVTITVHDDGPGIAADLIPELFERFTRADTSRWRADDGSGASTGLGLAIADAVVTAHGGSIEVSSRPGSTQFTITLPRVP